MSRFDYVKYDKQAQDLQDCFKRKFKDLDFEVTTSLKPGRATSLILTKLEEAYMWVGKAIRDEQLIRNKDTEAQEERSNS